MYEVCPPTMYAHKDGLGTACPLPEGRVHITQELASCLLHLTAQPEHAQDLGSVLDVNPRGERIEGTVGGLKEGKLAIKVS